MSPIPEPLNHPLYVQGEDAPSTDEQSSTMRWYYNGVEYSRDNLIPLVERLLSDPDAQAKFRPALIESITGLMDWGDYQSARETFDVMCAVLIQVDKAIGRMVLE